MGEKNNKICKCDGGGSSDMSSSSIDLDPVKVFFF